MNEVSVTLVTNNKDLIKRSTDQAILTGLEAVGLRAEGYAKQKCPVDTGNLRNSITHAVDMSEKSAIVATATEYAAYVEYGTSRQKAQPYLEPAVKDHVPEYQRIFEEQLARISDI